MMNAEIVPQDFVEALQKAWCKETAYSPCQAEYDDKDASFGNCLVSTMALMAVLQKDGFSDLKLIPGKVDTPNEQGLWHFRLRVDGGDIDLTWQQFEEGSTFREITSTDGEEYCEIMEGSLWEDDSLYGRLDNLIGRLKDVGGYDIGMQTQAVLMIANNAYSQSILQGAPGVIFSPS